MAVSMGTELTYWRDLCAAYKRLAEGLALRAPGMIGAANYTIERIEKEWRDGVFGERVEAEGNEKEQELIWLRKELEKLMESIDRTLVKRC